MKKLVKNNLIDLKKIHIQDSFWADRIKLISEKVIPYQWAALNDQIPEAEPSHAIENFRIAAGESDGEFHGMVFQDSDVAKWIEAASYSLITYPNVDLERVIDSVVELIARAQKAEGYINTFFTVAKPLERWKDFSFGHELYCAGHMIEAAVAYLQATGKRRLVEIMSRYVDYIDSIMGPEEHKMHTYPGHEEIELALVKLYNVTGEEKYLKLSQYFIDERGSKQPSFLESEPTFGNTEKTKWFKLDYHQAHAPVREQETAEGHSVRAMYLYSAMADLALESGDETLLNALKVLWHNVTTRRMYITGGLGSQGHAERFTFDYDLPNDTAYTETCASIGLIMWAQRMLRIEVDRKYADVMERTLYNGALSGISLDGTKYFYVNPLEIYPEAVENRYDLHHVKPQRVSWFGCACCPPNIARLITSIGSYIYTQNEQGVCVHLYIANQTEMLIEGNQVKLDITTEYPMKDHVAITISTEEPTEFAMSLRIPDWCRNPEVKINGQIIDLTVVVKKGYAVLTRVWDNGDIIELVFSMPIELVQSNPNVRENAGKLAIQRGPVVYCLEEVDNGSNLPDLSISKDAQLTAEFDEGLFGGSVVIRGTAQRSSDNNWEDILYRPIDSILKPVTIKAIPYSMWANRTPGEMLVWIRMT